MSLKDASKKMSKSDTSKTATISIIDDPEMIRLKIQKAKTDSIGKVR
jgi:tryptophanyl-tRNA synthetase